MDLPLRPLDLHGSGPSREEVSDVQEAKPEAGSWKESSVTPEGYEAEVERLEHGNVSERALAVALRYGQIDGDHHKAWVIDQMVRILAGGAYVPLVRVYENDGEYEWDEGIAP